MGDLKMCIYKKSCIKKKRETKKGVAVRKMAFWLNLGVVVLILFVWKKKGETIHGNQHSHERSAWQLTLSWKKFIATNTPMKYVHGNQHSHEGNSWQ